MQFHTVRYRHLSQILNKQQLLNLLLADLRVLKLRNV